MKKIKRTEQVTLKIAKDLRIGQNFSNFMHWVENFKRVDIFMINDEHFYELYNEWLNSLKN
jgi:hypothetical protein